MQLRTFNFHIIKAVSLVITIMMTLSFSIAAQNVKRGRNEGTWNIPASNVMGNGNITIRADVNGHYSSDGFGSDPSGSVAVGIADILQFSGKMSLTDFKTLGTALAEVQITTPGNNRLRFLGLAVRTSLFLSTSIDTVSKTAAEGKPEYHSYLRPSLIVDLDWPARYKNLNLKTYLWVGMHDNQDLLFRYRQIALRSGFEWKTMKNSFFTDIGLGLYKEMKSNTFSGDKGYSQQSIWIEPGVRYRIFDRISLLGALKVLILQRVKNTNGLPTNFVKLSIGAEIPLVYRETNTEAIRTMMFIEKEKILQKDLVSRSIEEGRKVKTDFELNFENLDQMTTTENEDKDAIKRREEIKKKMDEIESMLEALDDK